MQNLNLSEFDVKLDRKREIETKQIDHKGRKKKGQERSEGREEEWRWSEEVEGSDGGWVEKKNGMRDKRALTGKGGQERRM